MSLKRRRQEDEGEEEAANNGAAIMPKKRKGFTVGPSNLPDGTYRRKGMKVVSHPVPDRGAELLLQL